MTTPTVIIVPTLSDNYTYIAHSSDTVVVIDPGEAGPVLRALKEQSLTLTHILITHYDFDHIGGIDELVSTFGPKVIGPEPARVKLDSACHEGDEIALGDLTLHVIDTPGHADPHVSFYEREQGWLFSGDCLFGSGCGRVRGGDYAGMFASLQKLAELPDETLVFFGHDYTRDNLAFAFGHEPNNQLITDYSSGVVRRQAESGFSCPRTIADEKQTNPFLRTASEEIRDELGLADASDEAVFTALRKAKDNFAG